jgi:hypothetical protein
MQGNGARKGHTWLTNQIHQGERDEFTKPEKQHGVKDRGFAFAREAKN